MKNLRGTEELLDQACDLSTVHTLFLSNCILHRDYVLLENKKIGIYIEETSVWKILFF